MTARTGPPGRVRPPVDESGGREDEKQQAAGNRSADTLPRPADTTSEPVHISQCVAEFVTTLLDLGRSCGDIPIYGSPDWAALDRLDPRRFASVVRAAECWRRDGEPEAVRRRLDEDNWLIRYRTRQAGLDVHGRGDTDWVRIFDIVQARAGGYQPLKRTPQPWTAEQLGRAEVSA